jgi:4-amino-4-deoxy-L-arabinose transferase-like glycosyltransferase
MDVSCESWPAFLRRTAWIWPALVAIYATLAASLPPMDDEVYYWSWSQTPQLSYFDHPGMVAWLIWLSTRIFGDTVLGMRFPACCCVAFTLAAICYLTNRRSALGVRRSEDAATAGCENAMHLGLPQPGGRTPILLGIVLTPLFTFGAILITPDAPLLAAWSGYLLWLVAIHERLEPEPGRVGCAHQKGAIDSPIDHEDGGHSPPYFWWLAGGVLLGLGGLSKYTMILAVPAGLATFLLAGLPWRKWLPGYLLHGMVSAAVASPIVLYNWRHDFEPLLFQWRHAMHDAPASIVSFAEFWGVQVLLFGTLPLFLVPWTISHWRELRAQPRCRVCGCTYLIPLLFFVYKATRTELEGNWGLVAFVSVWPVAAVWYESVQPSRWWRWSTVAAFAPPALCVLGLAAVVYSPIPLTSLKSDRLSRQRGRWDMARQLARRIEAEGTAIPTYTPTYQMTALLRFWGVDAHQEATYRASHYTFPPEHLSDVPAAYVVTDRPLPPEQVAEFAPPKLIGRFPTVVRGGTVHQYELWRYEKRVVVQIASGGTPRVFDGRGERAKTPRPSRSLSACHPNWTTTEKRSLALRGRLARE